MKEKNKERHDQGSKMVVLRRLLKKGGVELAMEWAAENNCEGLLRRLLKRNNRALY